MSTKKVEDIKFKKRAKKHYKHRKNRSNKFSENMNLVVKKVTRYEWNVRVKMREIEYNKNEKKINHQLQQLYEEGKKIIPNCFLKKKMENLTPNHH